MTVTRKVTRSAIACLVIILGLASANDAAADVEVRGAGGAIDGAKLDALVRLELGDVSAPRVKHIVVEVKGARADVEVDVDGAIRRGAVDVPERDAERTLALFVAELARTADAPPSPSPAPAAPSPSAPPSERPPDPSHLAILATMGGRVLFRDGSLVLTPRAEVGWQWQNLRLGGIARYGTTSGDDVLGSVRAHLLTLGVAASQHIARESTLGIAHGPRLEAGLIMANGSGTNGANRQSFNATAAWELEARALVARPLALVLTIDLGILFPGMDLRADDRTVIDLAGPFASASAGVAF